MKEKQLVDEILEQYKREDINFDVYIIADVQKKTAREGDPRIAHADESEFFSRREFAEIASALFYVFGFARVFYSEMSFIEYIIHNKVAPKGCIVYNLSRDGVKPGKKSLIPAFCDLYGIKYTGSDAFVISLLRNKKTYSDVLLQNSIHVPITYIFTPGHTSQADMLNVFEEMDILIKNIDESASIGLTSRCRMKLNRESYQQFHDTALEVNPKHVLVQEFIAGIECEVLVIKYQGQYFALNPVEIIFSDGQVFMDSEASNAYRYTFKLLEGASSKEVQKLATKAAETLNIKDYARFDFRIRNGTPYLFDIAGTPYTIRHSSIAYLFEQYGVNYEDIYKVIVTCMLSNYQND